MRLLVITSRDLEKGSTKFRIAQFENFLRTQGVETAYVKRKEIDGAVIGQMAECDVVFNQKCLMNTRLSRKILNSGRTIFDFDDAIYTRPGTPRSFFTSLRVQKRMHLWLREADAVTTANHYLAEYAKQYSSSVFVVPMAIDLESWSPAVEEPGETVTIGWTGSPGNIPNLERLDPILSRLLKKHAFLKLAVFSGARPRLTCPFDYHPYRPGAEAPFVQRLDIGLLPLTVEEYSKGKSPIKAIQYLACGIPVVGNVSGATTEILNESNSIAVSSDEEWMQALESLIGNLVQRKAMGEAGRKFVMEHHDVGAVREQLLCILRGDPAKG
jgi:glycosyltransferase involved in cell wall biosynthesis